MALAFLQLFIYDCVTDSIHLSHTHLASPLVSLSKLSYNRLTQSLIPILKPSTPIPNPSHKRLTSISPSHLFPPSPPLTSSHHCLEIFSPHRSCSSTLRLITHFHPRPIPNPPTHHPIPNPPIHQSPTRQHAITCFQIVPIPRMHLSRPIGKALKR